ncbi:A24 family peptidase [Opitutus sp. ER46]|uniref:prepilin peptidase n=1 Tax=Opitutus sp. ER46 TaxID=2161864 RepID=UPI000D2FF18B|nr:A24 family peptidase [Opitutus sp. ER46]PTX91352.1 prepilin peptidase [Opitutus sp. ER46]
MTSASIAELSAAFPWFFPTVAFVLGACVGSFLNVVIYRVPAGASIVSPGSHCACGQPICWYDNIPILSWIILRGRARCCGRPFSIRYPAIELLTAVLFVVCWNSLPPLVAACGAVFVSALIAATFIDLDHMIIPDAFTLGLGVLGLLLSFWVPALHGQDSGMFLVDAMRSGFLSLQGLLVGSGLVLWIALVAEAVLKKEAMGFGDVKFVGAIGAFCGWQGAVVAIFGGALVGTVWFAVAWLWEKITGKRAQVAPPTETPDGEPTGLALGAHVPFGPMLAIAGALYFLVAHRWIDPWLGEVATLF